MCVAILSIQTLAVRIEDDDEDQGAIQDASQKSNVDALLNVSFHAVFNTSNVSVANDGEVQNASMTSSFLQTADPMMMGLVVFCLVFLALQGVMIWMAHSVISQQSRPVEVQAPAAQPQQPKTYSTCKEHIKAEVPVLNDAVAFRRARQIVKDRGIMNLREDLIKAGSMDRKTGLLKTDPVCNNVFAKIAAGTMKQPKMENDQEALGPYKAKFYLCANGRQDDENWSTIGADYLPRASMSRRHRFITVKDFHWQWFNPLIYGLVPASDGGVSIDNALATAIEIKEAAIHYAKNMGGWSEKVGVFAHLFGHCGLNCLYIHVVDLSELGPSFGFHFNKNCPFDIVIDILREEAQTYLAAKGLPEEIKEKGSSEDEQDEPDAPPKEAYQDRLMAETAKAKGAETAKAKGNKKRPDLNVKSTNYF